MGVNHGSGCIAVAEGLLDLPYVLAVLQKLSRKSVFQHVRIDILFDSCFFTVAFYYLVKVVSC